MTCDLDSAPEGLKTRPRTSASAGLPETCAAKTLSTGRSRNERAVRLGWGEYVGDILDSKSLRRRSNCAKREAGSADRQAWSEASVLPRRGCRRQQWDPVVLMSIGQYLSRIVQKWKWMTSRLGRPPPPPPTRPCTWEQNNNNTSTTCSKLFWCVCVSNFSRTEILAKHRTGHDCWREPKMGFFFFFFLLSFFFPHVWWV